MELVVRKNDLLRELQLFQGIVERKNTIPILAAGIAVPANFSMTASSPEYSPVPMIRTRSPTFWTLPSRT